MLPTYAQLHVQAKIALTHVYRHFTFELGPDQVPLKLRTPLPSAVHLPMLANT